MPYLSPYDPLIVMRHPDPPNSAYTGSGSPEGVVAAWPPRIYIDSDTNEIWVKASGDGTDTGWILMSGGGSGQVLQGSGAPTDPPSNTTSPAVYTDLDDGILYSWNVVTQAWI